MLYMFLLYVDPAREAPPDLMEQHFAVCRRAKEKNTYVYSEALGLGQTSTTVRVRNGKAAITDGPFAETKEVLGGFYVLDCKDLDEALEYAKQIPDAQVGAVEVRPVLHVPNWPYETGHERTPMS